MEERLTGRLLDLRAAKALRVDSERLFATTFLQWFGNSIPLYWEPQEIEVPNFRRKTKPDFVTPFPLHNGRLFYEVTVTRDTYYAGDKQDQYAVMKRNKRHHPNDFHLEINGNALKVSDVTMQALADMYRGCIHIVEVQKMVNALWRDNTFFQSVVARQPI